LTSIERTIAFLFGNPVLATAVIAALAALFTVGRNWFVHGPRFRARFFFVGSDLLIGVIGIGLLVLARVLEIQAGGDSGAIGSRTLEYGCTAIFAAWIPVLILTWQTERLAVLIPTLPIAPQLSINVLSGLIPLCGAVYLLAGSMKDICKCQSF